MLRLTDPLRLRSWFGVARDKCPYELDSLAMRIGGLPPCAYRRATGDVQESAVWSGGKCWSLTRRLKSWASSSRNPQARASDDRRSEVKNCICVESSSPVAV